MTRHQQRRTSRRKHPKNNQTAGRLPRNAAPIEVEILHIGGRGDGIAKARYTHHYQEDDYDVFVPASLPGEQLVVQPTHLTRQGIKARIIELKKPSHERQAPRCDVFPACGGCSFQHWNDTSIGQWKTNLVMHFLARASVSPDSIRTPHTSPPKSRRRASFHLKCLADGAVMGFSERMSTHIVRPANCDILHPKLMQLCQSLEFFASTHMATGFTADIHVNLLGDSPEPTLCVYVASASKSGIFPSNHLPVITNWAASEKLGRLTVDDAGGPVTLYAPEMPYTTFGDIAVSPPAGAFLQATLDGETALQSAVRDSLGGARRVADLFAGCGTLSLPLLPNLSDLLAVEADRPALHALKAGADMAGYGGRVTTLGRNLFEAPMLAKDLAGCEAVILDPPRSGALNQCLALGESEVGKIAMVSCNPASFSRDAAILTKAGFRLSWLQMIDQFSFSNHLELVGSFTRPA